MSKFKIKDKIIGNVSDVYVYSVTNNRNFEYFVVEGVISEYEIVISCHNPTKEAKKIFDIASLYNVNPHYFKLYKKNNCYVKI